MTDREMWWMVAVTAATCLPDGELRMVAIACTVVALVWVARQRDGAPPPRFIVKVPVPPDLAQPVEHPLKLDRPHLPASVTETFRKESR